MGLYFLEYDASSVVLHMKPVEHKRTTKERHHVVIPASNKLGFERPPGPYGPPLILTLVMLCCDVLLSSFYVQPVSYATDEP